MIAYARRSDQKREKRACLALTKVKTARRQELKKKREILRKNKENVVGVQYLPNCGINKEITLFKTNILNKITKTDIKNVDSLFDDSTIVSFYLETSGLDATADILQISARSENTVFNVYGNISRSFDYKNDFLFK